MTAETHDGVTPPLTARAALTLEQLAVASEAIGRTVRRVVVSEDAYRSTLLARGLPVHVADMLVGMVEASRAGTFARPDPMLERWIGHAPIAATEALRRANLA